jgi:hypothetical protein
MMKSTILVLTLLIFTFASCSKGDFTITDSLRIDNNRLESRSDDAGKDEHACITSDNKAGIRCFTSVGNSCKKLHECIAVTSSVINAGQFFTQSELDDWMNTNYRENRPFMIHMWEIGYFVHPDSIN